MKFYSMACTKTKPVGSSLGSMISQAMYFWPGLYYQVQNPLQNQLPMEPESS